jgi:hypothetical protein
VPGVGGAAEEVFVEHLRQPALAHRRIDHDAIDVDEVAMALEEPEIVGAVVVGALVEGHQEGRAIADAACVEGLPQKPAQPLGREPGEFDSVCVVEREDRGLVMGRDRTRRAQAAVSFRNFSSRRLTSAACSCCTQWPAPSTM